MGFTARVQTQHTSWCTSGPRTHPKYCVRPPRATFVYLRAKLDPSRTNSLLDVSFFLSSFPVYTMPVFMLRSDIKRAAKSLALRNIRLIRAFPVGPAAAFDSSCAAFDSSCVYKPADRSVSSIFSPLRKRLVNYCRACPCRLRPV